MYDVEYTCIKNPTPVIIKRKSEERASTWKVNGTYNFPAWMKSNRCTNTGPWNEALFTSKKIPSDTIKEANTERLPMMPPAALGNFFQPRPLIKNPSNGNRGTK